MKQQFLRNRAALGLGLCLAFGTVASHASTADGVKIGVLTDMAGVTADATGKGSVEAARLAIEEMGGTVLGKPISLVSGDHQHAPTSVAAWSASGTTPTAWTSWWTCPIRPSR